MRGVGPAKAAGTGRGEIVTIAVCPAGTPKRSGAADVAAAGGAAGAGGGLAGLGLGPAFSSPYLPGSGLGPTAGMPGVTRGSGAAAVPAASAAALRRLSEELKVALEGFGSVLHLSSTSARVMFPTVRALCCCTSVPALLDM